MTKDEVKKLIAQYPPEEAADEIMKLHERKIEDLEDAHRHDINDALDAYDNERD